MATYTTPKTWTNESLTAADMNTHLRDNMEAVKDPETHIYNANEASDLALTSTSWADVDATNFAASLTTNGGNIMIGLRATVGVLATTGFFLDVMIDGVAEAGGDGLFEQVVTASANAVDGWVTFFHFTSALSAGLHVIKLRYKINVATTLTIHRHAGTVNADVMAQFFVREVS